MRWAPVLIVACVLAGCGGEPPTRPAATKELPRLTGAEASNVAKYEFYFASTALDSSHYRGTLNGVDYLITLCRAKRSSVYTTGATRRTIKQVTEDAANTLREYQPDLAAKLDRVLDDNCA